MSYEQHLKSSEPIVVRCAVLTLSDTRTIQTDTSGKTIARLLIAGGHAVIEYRILPDEPKAVKQRLQEWMGRDEVDAILTTGGTGISRRDQTIKVVEQMLDQPLPGFGELFRQLSYEQIGSGAMLSRAIGGIAGGKVIFAMPGSTGAVELAIAKLILPELGHLVGELRK